MIDSVVELVNKTASNSLFMFLFCNFIIILILVGNSKPGSQDKSNPGFQKSVMISDYSVLSSKPGFENLVLISESILSSKSGLEKPGLKSESTICSCKPDLEKSALISSSDLSSKPGFEKSESTISTKTGLGKSMLISETVISSKPDFEKSKMNLSSNPGLQEPGLISKPAISSKPAGSEQSLTSKPGLNPGSDISEKDEKGNLEENESEVECLLRRRVEEFIRKVNTQWRSENTKRFLMFFVAVFGLVAILLGHDHGHS